MSAPSQPSASATVPKTRIQRRNREAILDAALEVFSQFGFRGATLDLIATTSGLSKQNVIYYFGSKDAIYAALLDRVLGVWLDPLRALGLGNASPVDEIIQYAQRKLELSRSMPRESRLFANEIVQGAPHVLGSITGPLKSLVDAKAILIQGWIDTGRLAAADPHHLLFSIWATTQHYADFDVQVRGILSPVGDQHFETASEFLATLYRRLLTPNQQNS